VDTFVAVLATVGGVAGVAAATYTALSARSIERYKAQLHAEGFEHEVRFARLHERRVEKIDDLYRKLVAAERAFSSWTSPLQQAGEPPMDEKGEAAAESANAFREMFLYSRIWLDEDLCERIAELDRELFRVFIDFTTYRPEDPRTHSEHMESWLAASTKVTEEIPKLRGTIEERFRATLGVPGAADG
jgi:hypothetical protein